MLDTQHTIDRISATWYAIGRGLEYNDACEFGAWFAYRSNEFAIPSGFDQFVALKGA
jgi:hypothetical protein